VLCPGTVETGILDATPAAHLPATATAPVTARAYLTAVGQHPIPAEVFARRALAQVARNRSIIIVPRSAKAFWYLQRVSPAAVEGVSRSLAKRVDRKPIRPAQG
jgi:short-subunit dehydrogenase